jgi:signal transduction histidine kinase
MLVGASILGAVLTGIGVTRARQNHMLRYPFTPWTGRDTVLSTVVVVAGVCLAAAGVWFAVRLPRNPTGWWTVLAAVSFGAVQIGTYSVSWVSPWCELLLPAVTTSAITMAVFVLPTGRMEGQWGRSVRRAVVLFAGFALVEPFIGLRPSSWLDLDLQLPAVGDIRAAQVAQAVRTSILNGVVPALVMATLYRRQRAMPLGARRTVRIAYLGAAVFWATELWPTVQGIVYPLILGRTAPGVLIQQTRVGINSGRYALFALALVVADVTRRRHAQRYDNRSIEVGPIETADLDHEIRRHLGDQTATLRYTTLDIAPGHSKSTVDVRDSAGRTVAHITHNPAIGVDEGTRRTLAGVVETAVARHVLTIEADRRGAEIAQVHRKILDSQDRTRRNLERDLHDGVQQRLVALSLQASRVARREKTDARTADELRGLLLMAIDEAVAETRQLLTQGVPAVLDPGLAAGLAALDATIPLHTSLEVHGDLPRSHPAATALWFVASEAVANSLKHAQASQITLRLQVDAGMVELSVADDGLGDAGAIAPVAIIRRLDVIPAELTVSSPAGVGTTIRVRVDLATAEALT